ncbi:MAG TPA: FtsX-like permease family protein [Streptosporangiaceae bacterium]|nr:FtsX-like permease family protein [Streptosporangiaceae bacterium]
MRPVRARPYSWRFPKVTAPRDDYSARGLVWTIYAARSRSRNRRTRSFAKFQLTAAARDRAAELAAIRTFGWRESALSRLVITEGAIIGLAGSAAGAALGLTVAAKFAAQPPAGLYAIAGAAVIAGPAITAAAALLPAQALRRMPAAHLLGEE